MRDRITQVLLGTFIATFIYSVLVVRTIRGSDVSGGFVPAISITVAIGLSLTSLVLLVYFIHHVSASIQASQIIRVIAENLEGAMPNLYPSETGSDSARGDAPEVVKQRGSCRLHWSKSGYLQTIDLDKLMMLAKQQDLVMRLLVVPGNHLLADSPVAEILGAREIKGKLRQQLLGVFYVDRERTPAQDIRYQFQQLTDVIVRALSPGINDPFTAINGIDELAAALLLFARRTKEQACRQDQTGALRLIIPTATLAEILRNTVGHIAIYAEKDHFVMDSLKRVLTSVLPHLQQATDRAVVAELEIMIDRSKSHDEI